MYCQCGCGKVTTIAPKTNTARGHIKGQHKQYLRGHGKKYTNKWLLENLIQEGESTLECCTWKGKLTEDGYARVSILGNLVSLHRTILEYVTEKKIPEGMEVHHTCFTRNCYNYKHLEIVTPMINKQQRRWSIK